MTLIEVGALGEVLGALGVIISLIYLSRQVRQNTQAVRTGNATSLQGNFQQLARVLYNDRETGALIVRAMSADAALTPEDRLAAYAYFFDMLKSAELAHYQFRRGELDGALWEASLEFYRAYFDTPGFRSYWERRRSAFIPEFREAMEGWLAAAATLDSPARLVGMAAEPPADAL